MLQGFLLHLHRTKSQEIKVYYRCVQIFFFSLFKPLNVIYIIQAYFSWPSRCISAVVSAPRKWSAPLRSCTFFFFNSGFLWPIFFCQEIANCEVLWYSLHYSNQILVLDHWPGVWIYFLGVTYNTQVSNYVDVNGTDSSDTSVTPALQYRWECPIL